MSYTRTGKINPKGGHYTKRTQRALKESALRIFVRRVFEEGVASSGKGLPAYSTKPLYVSYADAPRPRGGEPRPKGRFYPGGYAQYKRATFGTLKRIPVKTGRLKRSLTARVRADGSVEIYVKFSGKRHAAYITKRARWLELSRSDRVSVVKRFRALMRKEGK